MSGLADTFDLKDEEQAKEYLDTLGTEYRFQCYQEKRKDGCHRLGGFLEAFRKDFHKARLVFEKNCDDEYGHSCFKLGSYHILGRDVEKSPTESFKYFNKACDLGYASGCHNAALIHESGDLVKEKRFVNAANLLEKGCELNDVPSCQLLSTYFISGKEGVEKDMKKAFNFAKKACDGGHMYACANLSIMYRRGDGVDKNMVLALQNKERAQQLYQDVTAPENTIKFSE